MFSFCNRNNLSYGNQGIYDYSTNNLKKPIHKSSFFCDGSYQQQILNRGIPHNLIDVNSKLRGQNSHADHCFNDTRETQVQFSTLRPLPMYSRDHSKIPCMNVTSYKSEVPVTYLNQTRPIYGHPDLKTNNNDKF